MSERVEAMISAERTYAMLGQGALWETAQLCHQALELANLPHAVMGGMAVCLHGYARNTVDVDVLVRRQDQAAVRGAMESAGMSWMDDAKEFQSSPGLAVKFLLSGEKAGKDSEVLLPDPTRPQLRILRAFPSCPSHG